MFFEERALEHLRRMIAASSAKARCNALRPLLALHRAGFAALFRNLGGFPVAIRLFDPPLQEFLPRREDLMVDCALVPHSDSKARREIAIRYNILVDDLETKLPELLRQAEDLHEYNPIMGQRGCRVGIKYPEITELQARAILQAAVQVARNGINVTPQVMIPMVGSVEEFDNQRMIVARTAAEVFSRTGLTVPFMVGAMIEIPRAALTAGRLAGSAEFFAFGTNDLTQNTLGLSRDDYASFKRAYEDQKIFSADPFAVLDQRGVGQLIKMAVDAGRQERPTLEVGICGEPSSIKFCQSVGMDYVSCSPYRVPTARLAAAQGAIMADRESGRVPALASGLQT